MNSRILVFLLTYLSGLLSKLQIESTFQTKKQIQNTKNDFRHGCLISPTAV